MDIGYQYEINAFPITNKTIQHEFAFPVFSKFLIFLTFKSVFASHHLTHIHTKDWPTNLSMKCSPTGFCG